MCNNLTMQTIIVNMMEQSGRSLLSISCVQNGMRYIEKRATEMKIKLPDGITSALLDIFKIVYSEEKLFIISEDSNSIVFSRHKNMQEYIASHPIPKEISELIKQYINIAKNNLFYETDFLEESREKERRIKSDGSYIECICNMLNDYGDFSTADYYLVDTEEEAETITLIKNLYSMVKKYCEEYYIPAEHKVDLEGYCTERYIISYVNKQGTHNIELVEIDLGNCKRLYEVKRFQGELPEERKVYFAAVAFNIPVVGYRTKKRALKHFEEQVILAKQDGIGYLTMKSILDKVFGV